MVYYGLRTTDAQRGNSLHCTAENSIPIQSYRLILNTLNIDLILWHTQLSVCAENVKSWIKSWVIYFTFQAYNLPHTLNCTCVSLFKFQI